MSSTNDEQSTAAERGLARGLRIVEKNLRTETVELREQLARVQGEADFWREAWKDIIEDIGDLLHRAKARPKGRRFATVLELQVLLTKAENDDGLSEERSR